MNWNLTGYYAFSSRRHAHAVAPTTPAVILEMGSMISRSDLSFLPNSPQTLAAGISRGCTGRDQEAGSLWSAAVRLNTPGSAEKRTTDLLPDQSLRPAATGRPGLRENGLPDLARCPDSVGVSTV